MPRVPIESLPSDARVWVFGSARALSASESPELLRTVDEFLERWVAHGLPLTSGRAWRDGRFLAVAVDQRDAHASGCSIDGLYRSLRALEGPLGTALLGGGRVFYRDRSGEVRCTDRAGFIALAQQGEVTGHTVVFDPTVATLADWDTRFELLAAGSWHRSLLAAHSPAVELNVEG